MKKIIPFLFCMLIALFSCEKDTPTPPTPPTPDTPSKVETGAAENITATSATLKGMVNVDIIDYEELVFGVMYSTKAEDLVDFTAPSKNGLALIGNEFKVEVTDLKAKTKYYYRAYVMLNTLQILLGDVKEFTTLEKSGSEDEGGSEGEGEGGTEDEGDGKVNGYAYVDLGLSVKWATMNVGATSPEDYGDYFAWGETEPKSEYNWGTYKWCDGHFNNLTKYCSSSDFGIVDNKIELDLEDDAANVNWGDAWRTPTKAELYELIENCTWSWTTQNGIDGYKIQSKINANSIFLPAAGFYSSTDGKVYYSNIYWSRSPIRAYQEYAYILSILSNKIDLGSVSRCCGAPVRAVLP